MKSAGTTKRGMTPSDVMDWFEQRAELAAEPNGNLWIVPKDRKRSALPSYKLDDWILSGLITEGRNPAIQTVKKAVIGLTVQAAEKVLPVVNVALRVARLESMVVVDLGIRGTNKCVIATKAGWKLADEVPPGIVFERPKAMGALPEPVRGGSLDELQQVISLSETQWLLVRGWLVASVLPDIPRPLLSFYGTQGSGKTTRGKFVLSVLEPTKQLGSSFGKNQFDDVVKAKNRYYVGFDNVSLFSKSTNDFVCRLVTGEHDERRVLYSNSESVTIEYLRTGVITSRTMPNFEEDGMERIIPVALERFDSFTTETALHAKFNKLHPRILGGLLDAVVKMLRGLNKNRKSTARLSDYDEALYAYDTRCSATYIQTSEQTMCELAEDDPFIQLIKKWLHTEGGKYRAIPTDAFASIEDLKPEDKTDWWPATPRAMSQMLSNRKIPLKHIGINFTVKRLGGLRYWDFQTEETETQKPVSKVRGGKLKLTKDTKPKRRGVRKTPEMMAKLAAIRAEEAAKAAEKPRKRLTKDVPTTTKAKRPLKRLKPVQPSAVDKKAELIKTLIEGQASTPALVRMTVDGLITREEQMFVRKEITRINREKLVGRTR